MDPMASFHRLRGVLRANAGFSMLGGVFALAGFAPVDAVLGTGNRLVVAMCGLGLIAFAVVVAVIPASPPGRARRGAVVVSLSDATWCVGTAALLVAVDLRAGGVAVLVGIAVVVAGFGLAQARLALRSSGIDADADVPEHVHLEHTMDAPAHRVWPLLADHDLYGRLAPNLSRVEVVGGAGVGMQRRCYSTSGRGWSERCVLWNEGSRFAVEVDTSDYPYPLAVMRGAWSVVPVADDRSRVSMDFELVPRRGIFGALFVIVMLAGFRPVLRRIVSGWQRALATATPAASV